MRIKAVKEICGIFTANHRYEYKYLCIKSFLFMSQRIYKVELKLSSKCSANEPLFISQNSFIL